MPHCARLLVSCTACGAHERSHLRQSLTLQIGRDPNFNLIRKSSRRIAVSSDIPGRHCYRLMAELVPDQKGIGSGLRTIGTDRMTNIVRAGILESSRAAAAIFSQGP
jgi:hypothetical protein